MVTYENAIYIPFSRDPRQFKFFQRIATTTSLSLAHGRWQFP